MRYRGWFLLLGIYLAARCLFWWVASPNPDEAYYWLWGQHPDWSYHDHPPLAAWIQGVMSTLFGRSPFVLRLPSALTTVGTFLVYRTIVRNLYPCFAPTRSTMVVATVIASPLMFIFMALAWHDHLLILLCLTAGHFAVRYLAPVIDGGRGHVADLFFAATATGLAGLTKYNALFMAIGIAVAVLARRNLRPALRDPWIYFGVAWCGFLVSPVLRWNALHGQRSFQFHFVERIGWDMPSFEPYFVIPFILLTLALLSPFQAFRLACFRRWRWDRSRAYGQAYVPIATAVLAVSTTFFVAMSMMTNVLAYWNIVAYLMLFPLAVGAWHRRRFLLAEQIYGVVFASLFAIHSAILPLSTLVNDQGDKDTRMIPGWPHVAARVRHHLDLNSEGFDFIATSDYRSASALAFAMDDPCVTAISNRTDQFDVWQQTRDHAGEDAMLVTGDWYPMHPGLENQFDTVEHLESVPVIRFGIQIKSYDLYRATVYHPLSSAQIPGADR